MPLLSMAFDSNCTFKFERCAFIYKDRQFMFFAGDHLNCHVVETIIANTEEEKSAFSSINEFLYLFGLYHNCGFHFMGSWLHSYDGVLIKKEKPSQHYPRVMGAKVVNFETIASLPMFEECLKALSLYNEAMYSSNIFNKFLCFYNVLDIPFKGRTGKSKEWVEEWVTQNVLNVLGGHMPESTRHYIREEGDIGYFFREHCRNAISHVHRFHPSLPPSVFLFELDDYKKVLRACAMIEPFAQYFIKKELGYSTNSNTLIEVVGQH